MGEKLLIYEHRRGRYFATESELDEILNNSKLFPLPRYLECHT